MSFDALAMHAVRDELESTVLGGFVEKVLPLSELEIGLRLRSHHRDFNLLFSAEAQSARAHLVGDTLRRLSEDVSPFLLLMRKYARESRIVSSEQPPLERVMSFGLEGREEDGSIISSRLIIEVMGRHSNVILVGADGKVLDAIKRVPPSLSRQRPILPHMPYAPPPAVEKLNPRSPLLARQLATAAKQVPPSTAAWRFVQDTVTGMGPLGAREVVFRACGNASCTLGEIPSVESLASEVAGLFKLIESHAWTPCIVVQDGAVIHFAPYRLTQFPEEQVQPLESISEAIERAFADRIQTRPGEALRVPLRASIKSRIDRVVRREDSLRLAVQRGEKAEELKLTGQAILASVGTIEPGQKELRWQGKTVQLDPKLTPAENAQRYFREYAKSRDAAREIPGILETVRHEREYLEQLLALVEVAEDEPSLRTLSRELADLDRRPDSAPLKKVDPRKGARGKPEPPSGTIRRFTSRDGHQILVGGSARGNERVTFDLANGADIWFHARGIPGAHVILKVTGRDPSQETVLEAARYAALFSQAHGTARVPVDYTQQRFVKKIKGGPMGLVTYTQEKTVRVDGTTQGIGDRG